MPVTTASPTPALLERIRQCREAALRSGALQPIATERAEIDDHGLHFSVRWISSLERKHAQREQAAGRRDPGFNPFLPPEAGLTVGELGADHLAVLNKFPVIDDHLLVVTRHFVEQSAPLDAGDFTALARVLGPLGGLGFYNGGTAAGASQRHKHLQWIPRAADDTCLGPFAPGAAGSLPFRHATVALGEVDWSQPAAAGARLHTAFAGACASLGMDAGADPMPPYNLLIDRQRMLLVPRCAEHWQDISVNALGFAGSLFVRRPAQLDSIRACGPLQVLTAVGCALP